jgi:hypothetical protein
MKGLTNTTKVRAPNTATVNAVRATATPEGELLLHGKEKVHVRSHHHQVTVREVKHSKVARTRDTARCRERIDTARNKGIDKELRQDIEHKSLQKSGSGLICPQYVDQG